MSDYREQEVTEKTGSKGFYVALAVCLVAVCGVAVATFAGGLSKEEPSGDTTRNTTITTAVPVVNPATNVKDERTTATTGITTTTVAPKPTTTAQSGLFVFPVSNTVTKAFSDTPVYSETLGSWSTHNGVDFAAKTGDRVKAPADGTVKRIYQDGLWGDVIELEHGGRVISRCCGVKAQGIKEGDAVKAGSMIGTVSSVPAEIADGEHVHLEILANDKYVDPLLLLQGKTVTAGTTVATK